MYDIKNLHWCFHNFQKNCQKIFHRLAWKFPNILLKYFPKKIYWIFSGNLQSWVIFYRLVHQLCKEYLNNYFNNSWIIFNNLWIIFGTLSIHDSKNEPTVDFPKIDYWKIYDKFSQKSLHLKLVVYYPLFNYMVTASVAVHRYHLMYQLP